MEFREVDLEFRKLTWNFGNTKTLRSPFVASFPGLSLLRIYVGWGRPGNEATPLCAFTYYCSIVVYGSNCRASLLLFPIHGETNSKVPYELVNVIGGEPELLGWCVAQRADYSTI